ncbi:hypothetical protein ACFQET_08325 [Levilactobacillus tangyuanensis]|uniref:Uncharacterized protein n=1 Tax=Levilactobacillus tangyuanensis TaxID=2486021 RepID=A0ABW1TR33_9LACO|nr:hypothetical protein [Levilactobacillus tangyuanensis]
MRRQVATADRSLAGVVAPQAAYLTAEGGPTPTQHQPNTKTADHDWSAAVKQALLHAG